MKNAFCRDARGFTLVELLVAVVMLAIVVVPLLHSFVAGAQTAAASRRQNDATAAAQRILESLQASDTASLLASDYTPEKANGRTTGVYTRSERGVVSNGSSFDTEVTLTPVDAVNSKAVAVGNPMDAVSDMTGADADALNEFEKACNGNLSAEELKNVLTRSIEIRSELQKDASYVIYVTFRYGGTAVYTTAATDEDTGEPRYTQHRVTLSYQSEDKVSASLPDDRRSLARIREEGGPAYSLYLYFAPIVHTDARTYYNDKFSIYNTAADGASGLEAAGYDFNVFLIDTLDTGESAGYQNINYLPVIHYYGQHHLDRTRVFSNLQMTPGTNFLRGYTAHSNTDPAAAGKWITKNFDGTLVEKQQRRRMSDVEVKIFRSGTDTDPLVIMNAVKLG